ncbi:xylulokinase [Gracilibacillus suaedae]|uniref:xylulokinase n=1 Tax=Gracilibacillus suaedae TaxID=2820273 RepID=UPI001ABEA662|nr:FGGY-family carbohydrate kinase [Gracilibacillus suaedae]
MTDSSTFILAHDIGTSGVKATLFNSFGNLFDSYTTYYQTYFMEKNEVEQNPEYWWEAICLATKHLLNTNKITPSEIEVITFSGQMMGVVPVNKEANPIRKALIWADMRASQQAYHACAEFGEDHLYQLTGNKMTSSYSGAKMAWLKKNEPTSYHKAYKLLQAKDYIVAKLTGNFLTDFSDVSGTNLYDIYKKEWMKELIHFWGLDIEKLPEVVSSTTIAGYIKEEMADQIGLLSGTPVVIGGGDGACAALGAGITQIGDTFNYLGSSSWIAGVSDTPILDKQKRTFNFIHLDHAKYLPMGTMQAAGSLIDWVISQWYKELAAENKAYEIMNQEISESTIGAKNLVFLPYLLGERSPWWNADIKASILGLTAEHQRGDIARAAMEGISFNLSLIYDAFIESGLKMDNMWLFGGGANSQMWRQMLSDLYNIPLTIPHDVSAITSKGAAMVGGIGIGLIGGFNEAKKWSNQDFVVHPNPETKQAYDIAKNQFIQAFHATKELF